MGIPVRVVGQRWIVKEGSRLAILAEIVGVPGTNYGGNTKIQVLQVICGGGFRAGQQTELSFDGEPLWSYELLEGQEKPQ